MNWIHQISLYIFQATQHILPNYPSSVQCVFFFYYSDGLPYCFTKVCLVTMSYSDDDEFQDVECTEVAISRPTVPPLHHAHLVSLTGMSLPDDMPGNTSAVPQIPADILAGLQNLASPQAGPDTVQPWSSKLDHSAATPASSAIATQPSATQAVAAATAAAAAPVDADTSAAPAVDTSLLGVPSERAPDALASAATHDDDSAVPMPGMVIDAMGRVAVRDLDSGQLYFVAGDSPEKDRAGQPKASALQQAAQDADAVFYKQHTTFLGISAATGHDAHGTGSVDSHSASSESEDESSTIVKRSSSRRLLRKFATLRRKKSGNSSSLASATTAGSHSASQDQLPMADAEEGIAGTFASWVHRKDIQEMSAIRAVQSLWHHAHAASAVWAAAWSHDGEFFASAGGAAPGSDLSDDDAVLASSIMLWRVLPWAETAALLSGETSSVRCAVRANSSAAGAASNSASGIAETDSDAAGPTPSAHDDEPVPGAGSVPAGWLAAAARAGLVPVLAPAPAAVWRGHTGHVVNLAWSRGSLLVSAGMDGAVRMWHPRAAACLHKFLHPAPVTSVAFHPFADNYIVTTGWDKRLRLWAVDKGRLAAWCTTREVPSAAQFAPDGRTCAIGLYDGTVVVHKTEGLEYITQVQARNARGRFKRGCKVCSVQWDAAAQRVLVATNDNAVRLFDAKSWDMLVKFGGARARAMHLAAGFDSSCERVVRGSERGAVHVWRAHQDQYTPAINPRLIGRASHKNKSYEYWYPSKTDEQYVRQLAAAVSHSDAVRPDVPESMVEGTDTGAGRSLGPLQKLRRGSGSTAAAMSFACSTAAAAVLPGCAPPCSDPTSARSSTSPQHAAAGPSAGPAAAAASAAGPAPGHVTWHHSARVPVTVAGVMPIAALTRARPADFLFPTSSAGDATQPAPLPGTEPWAVPAGLAPDTELPRCIVYTADTAGVLRFFENVGPAMVL